MSGKFGLAGGTGAEELFEVDVGKFGGGAVREDQVGNAGKISVNAFSRGIADNYGKFALPYGLVGL